MTPMLSAPANASVALAVLPVVVVSAAFVVYCLTDLARSEVRYLPKWGWAAICLMSIPFGGLVYLLVGRKPR
jgi:hypothetical protein